MPIIAIYRDNVIKCAVIGIGIALHLPTFKLLKVKMRIGLRASGLLVISSYISIAFRCFGVWISYNRNCKYYRPKNNVKAVAMEG